MLCLKCNFKFESDAKFPDRNLERKIKKLLETNILVCQNIYCGKSVMDADCLLHCAAHPSKLEVDLSMDSGLDHTNLTACIESSHIFADRSCLNEYQGQQLDDILKKLENYEKKQNELSKTVKALQRKLKAKNKINSKKRLNRYLRFRYKKNRERTHNSRDSHLRSSEPCIVCPHVKNLIQKRLENLEEKSNQTELSFKCLKNLCEILLEELDSQISLQQDGSQFKCNQCKKIFKRLSDHIMHKVSPNSIKHCRKFE